MEAVESFTGAVVLVSHDQSLLATCTQLYLVENRKPLSLPNLNPNQLRAKADRLPREQQREKEKAAKLRKAAEVD